MEKKRRKIFFSVSYGIPLLSFIFMFIGYQRKVDLNAFTSMFMYVPALAVMLGVLMTQRNQLIPKRFFIGHIVVSIIMIFIAVLSIFLPNDSWVIASQLISMAGSLLASILLFTEKKDKRLAYGLRGGYWKLSLGLTGLFVVLYVIRMVVVYAISGQLSWLINHFSDIKTWGALALTVVMYLINWMMYFGEEYGWRYYLQPLLQKRFGTFKGVLVLGLLWGLWHAPLNFFFYAKPDIGIFSLLGQIMTCTGLGLFFAYCYMKTQNIWLVTFLHFLNNNLALLFSDTTASQTSFSNGQIVSSTLLMTGFTLVLFSVVALSKVFKQPSQLPTLEERLLISQQLTED